MSSLVLKDILESNDGITTRLTFSTEDGFNTEGVYVNYKNKHIVCYSTQIDCNNKCKFCYNGIHPCFRRNLTSNEIVDLCKDILKFSDYNKNDQNKPILFSAMGVGEPLDNYSELEGALNKLYLEYPNAKYTISSCLTHPANAFINLISLTNSPELFNMDLKLQISLHTPFDEQRKELMPNAGDLDMILLHSAIYAISGHKIEFNYILIDGINDTEFHAMAVVEKITKSKLGSIIDEFVIKINKFNKVIDSDFKPSNHISTNKFINILLKRGLKVEYYETDGSDINAACGQYGKVNDNKGGYVNV